MFSESFGLLVLPRLATKFEKMIVDALFKGQHRCSTVSLPSPRSWESMRKAPEKLPSKKKK
jgi:hypothetical protein